MPRFDPGLQPERTALAWRRTALSAAIGSAIAMRVLPDALGDPLWLLPGTVCALAAAALHLAAGRRERSLSRRLADGDRSLIGTAGGALLALFAALATAAGATGMAAALLAG